MENKSKDEQETEESSWWNSWYDIAKQKLAETNEFMMRDMKEFTQAVKDDASKLVASTAAQMKDQLNININLEEASEATKAVTNSLTDFLGKVVKQVSPLEPDDSDEDSFLLGTRTGVKTLSPAQARLYHLQTNPETYCTEPDNGIAFEEWSKNFDVETKKEEISSLILDCKEVRTIFNKLVPDAVTHEVFWTRYFYKKNLHEEAEERRAKLVERAQSSTSELAWDDDDDEPAPSNISSSQPLQSSSSDLPSSSVMPSPVKSEEEEDQEQKIPETVKAVEKIEETPTSQLAWDDDDEPAPSNVSSSEPLPVAQPSSSDLLSSPVKSEEDEDQEQKISEDRSDTNLSSKEASSCEMIEHSDFKTSKASSSGGSSDWEKDFEIDMTEEEIKNVLDETDDVKEDDWEGWE